MNRALLTIACVAIATANLQAERIRFLNPDGSPAKSALVYQTRIEYQGNAGGMGMGMDMGMMGMEEDYGDGGMDMMEDMMGMGGQRIPKTALFLNWKPISNILPEKVSDTGAVEILDVVKQGGGARFKRPLLAFTQTGISFIPAGSRVRDQVRLRRHGLIIVPTPSGIDPSRYRVLTCWRNGFAWPTDVTEFSEDTVAQSVDQGDWRFRPRFQFFQLGELNRPLVVPPGEIRATIVPAFIDGKPIEEVASKLDSLEELSISGGPSTLVLVTGKETTPASATMQRLVNLEFRLPINDEVSLPNWEDDTAKRYLLVPESVSLAQVQPQTGYGMGGGMDMEDMMMDEDEMGYGMMDMMGGMGGMPSAIRIGSVSQLATVLNQKRSARASVPVSRTPTLVTEKAIRFELIPPGKYWLAHSVEDGAMHHHKIASVKATPEGFQVGLGPVQYSGEPKSFQVPEVLEQAEVAGSGSSTSLGGGAPAFDPGKTRWEKLRTVQKMRTEIEAVLKRLSSHHQRLLSMEAELSGKGAGMDGVGTTDPYGGSIEQVDPFGGPVDADPFDGPGEADPFGGEDPFGG